MDKKKIIRLIIQIAVGLLIAIGVMNSQGAFESGITQADRILAIGNGFSVTALLYLSFGMLVWISTTGVLDIFSFAIQRGAHFLVPFAAKKANDKFYEFKVEREAKRKKRGKGQYMTLFVGLGFLLVAIVLTAAWYLVGDPGR